MERIIKRLTSKLKRQAAFRVILGFLSLGLGSIIFVIYENAENTDALLLIGALILTLTGAVLASRSIYILLKVKRLSIVSVLEQRSEEIIWIYPYFANHQPFGILVRKTSLLYFYLLSGEHYTIELPEKELKKFKESLKPFLPHVVFGYTLEREQLYRADPYLLKE